MISASRFAVSLAALSLPLKLDASAGTLFAVAGRRRATAELIGKVVNVSSEGQAVRLGLRGAGLGHGLSQRPR